MSVVLQDIEQVLYHALVYPYLHYGNIIWANTYPTRLDKIKKLQKKIIRIITFSNYTAETAPLFKKLSILSIDNINNEAVAIFMFRYFNNGLPISFQNFFKLNKELHNYNTRSSTQIHKNYIRTNYKKYSTVNKGREIWNCLPNAIKDSKSLNIFKSKIRKHYITS